MTSLILHSLAARYGQIMSGLAQITGKRLRRIYIVGGGSRNTLLNRLTEAAAGLEVRVEPWKVRRLAILLCS